MRHEPLYDRLLVKILETDSRTKGGLWIPDMALDNTPYLRAEVLAVGHGRITTAGSVVPLKVVVGDVITFFRSQSSGEQLVFPSDDGTELMLIREANVTTIIRDLDKVTSIQGVDGRPMVLQS